MKKEEILSKYQDKGYLIGRNIIHPPDLNPLRNYLSQRIDEYAREQFKWDKIKSLYENLSFERRLAAICEERAISKVDFNFFPSSIDYFARYGPILYELYQNPEILRILGILLGSEVNNHGLPQLRSKLPGSIETSFPWHQDSLYYNEPVRGTWEKGTEKLHILTVWVPLVDVTIGNGCLWIIPGSHRWGLLKGARSDDNVVRMEDNVETRGTPTPLPMKLGDVLFLTNLTVHTSKLNKSNKSRWSIDFRNHATPESRSLSDLERSAAKYLNDKARSNGWEPLTVITDGCKPSWEEWFNAKKKLI